MEDNNQQKEGSAGELEQIKKEKEEYLNGWKRAKADLINYQKEEGQRFEEVVKFGNLTLIGELIQVLDSFAALERSIKGEPRSSMDERDLAGVIQIKSQLEDVLRKRGVEAMKTSAGDKFDPAIHEAVSEVESKEEDGAVVEEVEKGYILNGRVIRPSKVKISKNK